MNRCAIFPALFILAACASTKTTAGYVPPLQWADAEKRVALGETCFDLYEDPLGADPKPRVDWDDAARGLAATELQTVLAAKHIRFVADVPSGNEASPSSPAARSLPDAINPMTCRGATDALRHSDDADYVLSIQAHNVYFSRGAATLDNAENAVVVLGLAAVSVALPGIPIALGLSYLAIEGGYCDSACRAFNAAKNARRARGGRMATISLIAANTGDVVWSDSIDGGDWRDAASVKKAVAQLLAASPL